MYTHVVTSVLPGCVKLSSKGERTARIQGAPLQFMSVCVTNYMKERAKVSHTLEGGQVWTKHAWSAKCP